MATDPPAAPTGPRRGRARLLRMLWIPLVALASGFAAWALIANWSTAAATFAELSAGELTLAGLAAVASAVLAGQMWTGLARELGATGPRLVLARIFFVGQLGKYLPGPAWPVVLQGGLGDRARQSVRSTAGAAAFCVALAPVVGVPLGLALVLAGAPGQVGRLAWLALPVLPLLALLHPTVFNRVLAVVLRVARRPPVTVRLSAKAFTRAAGWQAVTWLAVGAQTAILVHAVAGGSAARLTVLGAGAAILAYCAGMFALVLPAGLGVREGVLVLLLAPGLGAGRAAAVTVASRLLLIGADLVLAALALLAGRTGAAAGGRFVRKARFPRRDRVTPAPAVPSRDPVPTAAPGRTEPRRDG